MKARRCFSKSRCRILAYLATAEKGDQMRLYFYLHELNIVCPFDEQDCPSSDKPPGPIELLRTSDI